VGRGRPVLAGWAAIADSFCMGGARKGTVAGTMSHGRDNCMATLRGPSIRSGENYASLEAVRWSATGEFDL
jgi:hypothetical protein